MSNNTTPQYRERLWPSLWLLGILLLLLPSVMLIVIPLNAALAVPIAIATYVIIAGTLILVSPKVEVTGDSLVAGNAHIPLSMLGDVTLLGSSSLKRVIGPEADARAYLVVRGHLHQGIKVAVTDERDPAPYWVITSRKPQELARAIENARGSAA
ncbi:MAG: DUF3093 domain-containing protein [Microbacteriaceae bacterium]|nr:DUF3093 domain-containing protein [Microbacteriaceae bacterium]